MTTIDLSGGTANDQGLAEQPVPVAAPAPAPVTVTPTAATVAPVSDDFLVKLKGLLTVLGHDLESAWDDAVALAKKAL